MAKGTSPTQRSLKHLKELGWTVQKCEYWNSFARRRIDIFNFGDLVGCRAPDVGPTLFQVTTTPNVPARLKKAREYAGKLMPWILTGGRLVVHGWAKRGPRGEPKTWQLKEIILSVTDLTSEGVADARSEAASGPV